MLTPHLRPAQEILENFTEHTFIDPKTVSFSRLTSEASRFITDHSFRYIGNTTYKYSPYATTYTNCIEASLVFLDIVTQRPHTQAGLFLSRGHAVATARDPLLGCSVYAERGCFMTLADMRKKTIYGPETDLDDAWNATNADHGIFSVHRNKDLSLTTVVYDSDYRHRFDVDTTPEDSRVLLVGDDALTAARAIIGFELASNEEEKSYFAALKPSVRPHVLNKASKAE